MYKLIILDVDGTLYDLDDVCELNYNIQIDFYSSELNISKEEAKLIFDRNGILPYKSETAKSATEFFLRTGLNGEKWKRYRESHYSPETIDQKRAVREETLRNFCQICDIILLSSNTYKNILDTLKWIKIDISIFKDIFCATKNPGKTPFNKKNAMEYILKKFHVLAQDVLSIGDRYSTDIEPLLNMGGDGVLVQKPEVLLDVYYDLLHGCLKSGENDKYIFFSNN